MRHERNLRSGDTGVGDTICLMQKFVADYKDNQAIKQIVSRHRGGTDWETAKALHDYVVRTIKYVADPPNQELVKSAKHTILGNSKYGDCDDLSVALATLFEAAGIKTYFRTVAWRPKKRAFTHVYVVAYIKEAGGYVPFDPTMGKSGKSKEVKYHRERTWNNGSKTCWVR